MTILASVNNKTLMPGITPIADIPDAPTIGTATAGVVGASVPFTAATTGGTASTFTATSSPGSITGTSATSPISVSGLIAGTSYTFTVTGSNSTGTGPASSASNSIIPADLVGSYDALNAVTLSSAASSVTFSGIPSGYKHLQLRAMHTFDGNNRGAVITLNNDTGSNYARHYLSGDGATMAAGAGTSLSNISFYFRVGNAGTTQPEVEIIDILDYANTTKNKTIKGLVGVDNNGSGEINLVSGLYLNRSPVSTITITSSAGNFNANSSFALYGVR
jgi:hypothetical protein